MDINQMLAQAMEQPNGTIRGNEYLSELKAWDSLAVLNFMALVDANCGITLSPETLLGCETVDDIGKLLATGAGRRP